MKGSEVISIVVVLLMMLLFIVIGLKAVDNFFKGSKDKNFYRLITICLGLNVMIFMFLIMTFGKIQLAPGPQGPQGNRGDKGLRGNTNNFNTCHKQVMTSGDKKYKILRKQNAVAKNPALVLDDNSDITF